MTKSYDVAENQEWCLETWLPCEREVIFLSVTAMFIKHCTHLLCYQAIIYAYGKQSSSTDLKGVVCKESSVKTR